MSFEFWFNVFSVALFYVVARNWKSQLNYQFKLEIQFKFLELLYDLNVKLFNASIWVSPRVDYDRNLLTVAWESHSACERFLFNYRKYLDETVKRLGKKILDACANFLSMKVEYESVKRSSLSTKNIEEMLRDSLNEIRGLYRILRDI